MIYKNLIKNKYTVWTEAVFKSGKRADIVAIKEGMGYIIEIETPKTPQKTKEILKEKCKIYPKEFDVIVINTNKFNPNESIGIE